MGPDKNVPVSAGTQPKSFSRIPGQAGTLGQLFDVISQTMNHNQSFEI